MLQTAENLALPLPPLPLVRQLAYRLDSGTPRDVLDVGCGTGRNSLYLAGLGHHVVGLSPELSEVQEASGLSESLGSVACSFIVADARALPVSRSFDIVMANELLHLMPKTESRMVLDGVRAATRQGGINVVSGYVVRPGTANRRNTARMFAPGELEDSYRTAGWQVIHAAETYYPVTRTSDGKEHVHSKAELIAARPW